MADAFADYYRLDVRARAEFDEPAIETPVLSFQLNFRLDEIAKAVIRVPLGRNPVTGEVSSALGAITEIEARTRVRIYASATPSDGRAAPPGKDPGFPDEETLVFDGFVASPKVVRGVKTASLELELFGPQAGLAGSTMLVNSVTFAELVSSNSDIVVQYGGGAEVAKDIFALLAKKPIEDDLWEIGVKPLMIGAIADSSVWTAGEDNGAATEALERINLGQVLEVIPLKLSVHDAPAHLLRAAVARTMGNRFYDAWASHNGQGDMWNALITLTNEFLFHFVPAVNEDALAPITPNLGGEPYRTIDPSEYNRSGAAPVFSPRDYAYRATVGLFARTFRTSQWAPQSGIATKLGVATIAPELLGQSGRVQLLQAPEWLLPPTAPARLSVGLGGPVPDAGNPTNIADADAVALAYGGDQNKFLESTLGNSVAATDLHEKLFAHRAFMPITGRLRMDIAPGSLIKVHSPGERFSGKKDTFFGMVNGVTVQATAGDGAGGAASTTLSIVGIRSEKEHETVTTPYHPLYLTAWRGGRLL